MSGVEEDAVLRRARIWFAALEVDVVRRRAVRPHPRALPRLVVETNPGAGISTMRRVEVRVPLNERVHLRVVLRRVNRCELASARLAIRTCVGP